MGSPFIPLNMASGQPRPATQSNLARLATATLLATTTLLATLLIPTPATATQATHDSLVFRAEGRAWGTQNTQPTSYLANAAGDLNMDGNVDLVMPHGTSLDVALNHGDGTFQQVVSVGASDGITAGSPVVADMNCDGAPDIVAGELGGQQMFSIFYGFPGNGVNYTRLHYDAGGADPAGIAVGDLDCNGMPDVVCVVQGASNPLVTISRNTNCGGFQAPVAYAAPTGCRRVYLRDINRDGLTDVILGSANDGPAISVYLGNGDGTLRTPRIDTNVSSYDASITFGDWNRDGVTDIAWFPFPATIATATFATMVGLGDGTFAARSDYTGTFASGAMDAGDLDDDGITDLVVLVNDRARFFRGLGNGAFVSPAIPQPTYAAGNGSCLLVDVDRDGHLDAVDEALQIHHGNGNGTFGDAPTYPVPDHPNAVRAASFNGDPMPDVVIATSDGQLATYSNAGGGIFAGLVSQPTGGQANDLAIADMNGDGKPDAVTTGAAGAGGFVSVHPGNGISGYGSPVTTAVDSVAYAEAIGDLNGDGNLDIALASGNGSIAVMLGNGSGGFGPVTRLVANVFPTSLVIADFNEDGRKDIIVGHRGVTGGSAALSAFFGNGNGTFLPRIDLAVIQKTNSLLVADMNGDGHLDCVVDGVRFLPGTGTGSVGPPILAAPSIPRDLTCLEAADVNLDGKLDIIGQGALGRVYVLLGRGDGNFDLSGQFLSYWAAAHGTEVGDWNGDGRPDFLYAGYDEARMMVHWNRGAVADQPPHGFFPAISHFSTGAGAVDLVAADFNRDGRMDAATPGPGDSVSVLLGDGVGGLGAPSYWSAARPTAVAAGDVNRDGKLDLVTCSMSPNPRVSVLLGNGSGGFASPTYVTIPDDASDVEIGDLNLDGNPDIVVAGFYPCGVQVLYGTGRGSFGAPIPTPLTGQCTYGVKIALMNRDCYPDLVVVSGECGTVEVLLGGPSGFATDVSYAIGDEAYSVVAGDFDHDSYMDVAAPRMFAGVAVMRGSASGALGPISSYASGDLMGGRASVGDLNNDGILDLVLAAPGGDQITILRGEWGGSFQPPDPFVTPQPQATAIADWNHDGNLDIGVARNPAGGAFVSLLLNDYYFAPSAVQVVPASAAPRVSLAPNAPNPFHPSTTIRFQMPTSGRARLRVFDVRGRTVATLVDRVVAPGETRVTWDGRDDGGRAVASGVYFYRVETDAGPSETRKMVLAR